MNRDPNLPDEIVDLLPLWIGGDLEQADTDRVSAAVADSDVLSEMAAELATARAALIDGLGTALELDSVPDLWPGVRVELTRSGLLDSAAVEPSEALRDGSHLIPRGDLLFFGKRSRLVRTAAAAALFLAVGLMARGYFGNDVGSNGGEFNGAGEEASSFGFRDGLADGASGSGGVSLPRGSANPANSGIAVVASSVVANGLVANGVVANGLVANGVVANGLLANGDAVEPEMLNPSDGQPDETFGGIRLLGTEGPSILERHPTAGVRRIRTVVPTQGQGRGTQLASEVR